MSKQQKTKSGFTIIEVVLVLAIAGLIFLMVFLALPALQRSQRDTQRRDDMARFAAQVVNYQTNNRGRVPNTSLTSPGGVWVTSSSNADVTTDGLDTTVAGNVKDSGDWATFLDSYMWAANDDFTDPGGTAYAVMDHGSITGDSTKFNVGPQENGLSKDTNNMVTFKLDSVDSVIHIFHGAICGTTEGTVEPSSNGSVRKLAFIYKLEGAGYYCGEV